MIYKNTSTIQKTFHGVTFKPGDIKEVPGYINDRGFVRVAELPKEPPKRKESAKSTSSKEEKEQPETKKEDVVNGSDSN